MINSRTCATQNQSNGTVAVNVGDTERAISILTGGFLLLKGISKLPFVTVAAVIAGGALVYRGLTGHCKAYEALGVSTSDKLENAPGNSRTAPLPMVTDGASSAADGSLPGVR